MKLVKPEVKLLTKTSYEGMVKTISHAARNCYQSKQGNLEQEERFLKGLIKLGHDSVLEHQYIGVELTLSRSDLAQLTRHRIGIAFSAASQRYCDYSTERFNHEVPIIKPNGLDEKNYMTWYKSVWESEQAYMDLVESGEKPEVARSVLPQCTATTVVMTANIREWRHIFKMRALNAHAQSDIRELMCKTLKLFHENYPCFFEDLYMVI